jgi:Zn-dependent protease/CBS domain-containing protein
MRNGFRIARIFGINIGVDWSWLLIFVLVAWNLSTVFASTHSDWGGWLSWGLALIAAILFFVSVLVHELAHSLVAKARGMPVRSIKLFLFGGVSNIEREPPSPGAEFLMALVGPLTSIVLGVLLVLAGGFSAPVGEAMSDPEQVLAQLNPLTTLLMWLGSINIFLGFFNLVPGFPLDGGRILRSIFWAVSDDLRRATRWAAWIGQGIAWLMIGAGIAMLFGVQIPLLGGGVSGGLWLAFIGWFLHSSAVMSYRQVVIQDILEDVPVARMMRSKPPTVSPTMTVDALVHDGVMGTDDHAFPVVDEGQLIGLVTLEDVRSIPRTSWDDTTVREIMTDADQLVSVTPEEDAAEALNQLQARDVRQLPVMRNGSLAGLLRRRDLVKWLQLHSETGLE